MRAIRRTFPDEAATLEAAGRLARRLAAPAVGRSPTASGGGTRRVLPAVVALRGPLGAGKTTFARGVLRALGHRGGVPSPTFAMVNEYRRTRPRVYHMDLYRAGPLDLPGLALEEYFADQEAVCLVEWPENGGGLLPDDRLDVALAHAGAGRRASLRATGPRSARLLEALR